MHSTCAKLLYRRYNPRSLSCCNSTRTLQFKYSFINTFPSSSTCHQNFKANLAIPNKIKAPTSSQKDIKALKNFSLAKSQRSSINKDSSSSLTQENSHIRQSRYPNRNHVTSNSSVCTRRIKKTSSPEICTPTNSSVTQKVTSKNAKSSKNALWSSHRKRNSRNSQSILFSSCWCIEDQKQNSKTISTGQQCYSHLNQMTISRKSSRTPQRYFLNCIFTIISCLKRPAQKTQRPQQEDRPSQRLSRMSSTRTTHILHIKTCMNNYSSTLKQQCFKASMSHQMVHCKTVMRHRLCNHHITQLATSTICNNTFYIILHCTHCSSHQSSYCTNNCLYASTGNTLFPKRVGSSNLKNTCCYQSSSVNLSGNGSRRCILCFHPFLVEIQQRTISYSSHDLANLLLFLRLVSEGLTKKQLPC